ncbi:unnamed protein product [Ceratitis capitata]|uniref:(Mediterranean fruit fly) hypothetical protein n=1 Tax=Ceratitis capitata TaxID=7213 RepID=A0A811VI64_CERCA|nr:unnamed protein product [Ceratitis capitata]
MEHNSASFDQRWPLLYECCLQAVHLLAVEGKIEPLAIGGQLVVDDSLPIPPKTQQNLPGHHSGLGPEPWPHPFALDAVVSDQFFIVSHNQLQKRFDFVVIQQRVADGNSVHHVFFALVRVAP